MKDLKKQKDLSNFLEHIVGNYEKGPARCLVMIAADVFAEVKGLCLK